MLNIKNEFIGTRLLPNKKFLSVSFKKIVKHNSGKVELHHFVGIYFIKNHVQAVSTKE